MNTRRPAPLSIVLFFIACFPVTSLYSVDWDAYPQEKQSRMVRSARSEKIAAAEAGINDMAGQFDGVSDETLRKNTPVQMPYQRNQNYAPNRAGVSPQAAHPQAPSHTYSPQVIGFLKQKLSPQQLQQFLHAPADLQDKIVRTLAEDLKRERMAQQHPMAATHPGMHPNQRRISRGGYKQPPIWKRVMNKGTSLLRGMKNLKRKMSISYAKQKALNLLGTALQKGTVTIWKHFGTLIEKMVGEDKFYEKDSAGKFKRDPRGNKIEKQFMTDKNGEYIIEKDEMGNPLIFDGQPQYVENIWLKFKNGSKPFTQFLLVIMTDRAMKKSITVFNQMIFRPMLHKLFDIPLWKLSYKQYKRHLYKKAYPGREMLDADYLAEKIVRQHSGNRSLLKKAGLTFLSKSKAKNMAERRKEEETNIKKAKKKLQEQMWEIYGPVWKEMRAQSGSALPSYPVQMAHEVAGIARATVSPIEDMATGTYGLTKSAVLAPVKLGKFLWKAVAGSSASSSSSASGSQDPETVEPWNDGPQGFETQINEIIDQIKEDENFGKKPVSVNVSIEGLSENHLVIPVSTQYKLFHAQEKVMDMLEEALPFSLAGSAEPYDKYLRRLLLPAVSRKILSFIPEKSRKKMMGYIPEKVMGISVKGRVEDFAPGKLHKTLSTLEKRFDQIHTLVMSFVSLISQVESLIKADRLAGNYTKLFDTIEQFFKTYQSTLRMFGLERHRDKVRDMRRDITASRKRYRQEQQGFLTLYKAEPNHPQSRTAIPKFEKFLKEYKVDPFTYKQWTKLTLIGKKVGSYAIQRAMRDLKFDEKPTITNKQFEEELIARVFKIKKERGGVSAEFFGEHQKTMGDIESEKKKALAQQERIAKYMAHPLFRFIMYFESTAHWFDKFYREWEIREVFKGIDETQRSVGELGIEPLVKIAVRKMSPVIASKVFIMFFGKHIDKFIEKLLPQDHMLRQMYGPFIPSAQTFASLIREITEGTVNGQNIMSATMSAVQQRAMQGMMSGMQANISNMTGGLPPELAGMANQFAGAGLQQMFHGDHKGGMAEAMQAMAQAGMGAVDVKGAAAQFAARQVNSQYVDSSLIRRGIEDAQNLAQGKKVDFVKYADDGARMAQKAAGIKGPQYVSQYEMKNMLSR